MSGPGKGKNLYSAIYVTIDLFIIFVSYILILSIFPLTSDDPFAKYNDLLLIYVAIWFVVGSFLWKYSSSMMGIRCLFCRILYSDLLSILLSIVVFQYVGVKGLSVNVLFLVSASVLFLELSIFSLIYNFRLVKSDRTADWVENSALSLCLTEKQLAFVKRYLSDDTIANLQSKGTVLELLQMEQKSCFVHTQRFNKVEEPNLFLAIANQKIADCGYFLGFFETKSARKRRLLKSMPYGLNYIHYVYDFFFKRFFPNFYLTSTFFSQLYTKIDRVYSKAEVYGRFYCAGFEFVNDCKIDGNTYFVFKKAGKPQKYKEVSSGLLIGLCRIGKNGRKFIEYKLRTMYPYSQYLQSFMISRNRLREGGKINKDVRITRFGAISRRLWIDELPQFVNLLKGDVKLVGVRPLSIQYFNLYTPELQQLRMRFKPGMLPPFYADMPKTLDEIQASEMKYLKSCEEKGVLFTDLKYLFLIFNNIVLRRARSH